MLNYKKIGLKKVIIITISIAFFVIYSLIGFWRVYTEQQDLKQSVLKNGENVVALLVDTMSHMVLSYDYTNLEEISNKLIQQDNISKVEIKNIKNKTMASATNKISPQEFKIIKSDLLINNNPVGHIILTLNLDNTNALFKEKIKNIFLEQIVIIISLIITLNLILSSLVIDPILFLYKKMAEIVKRPENEKPEDLPLIDQREFGELTSIFNQLNNKIYSYQEILQNKINLANEQLIEANSTLKLRAVDLETKTAELEKTLTLVEKLATTDSLTELYNRRAFEQFLEHEFNHQQRYQNDNTLILIDLDFFKEINDTYGHPAGDHTLKEFSTILQKTLRKTDIFARLGGDEFAVILSNTNIENAKIVVKKLMTAVKNEAFEYEGQPLKIGLSIGVSSFSGCKRTTAIVSNADVALYYSKKMGKQKASLYVADGESVIICKVEDC